ncbi:LiaF transmembrane domain-containing protein [Haloarcula litorea]|uniref:LiaF transmembrane domain-containing protein n=1 Tax=Haloarcula litorea TaxID=3032579 RepID=UPI0023E7E906|nr:hypothetical protein [Halomicroarcula sp. GDY20]
MSDSRLSVQTLLGGIIVVVGLALLARSTGLIDVESLLVYVPSLIVLLGLSLVLGQYRARTRSQDTSDVVAFAFFGGLEILD